MDTRAFYKTTTILLLHIFNKKNDSTLQKNNYFCNENTDYNHRLLHLFYKEITN